MGLGYGLGQIIQILFYVILVVLLDGGCILGCLGNQFVDLRLGSGRIGGHGCQILLHLGQALLQYLGILQHRTQIHIKRVQLR